MDERDPITESLERLDRPGGPSTLREGRREFGAAGGIDRPDDMREAQAGTTILERLKSRFTPRAAERDAGRQQNRR